MPQLKSQEIPIDCWRSRAAIVGTSGDPIAIAGEMNASLASIDFPPVIDVDPTAPSAGDGIY
jgi:hypothetical protein